MTDHELVAAAWRVRERAQARYSHYRVGAALLAASGDVFTGTNVESSSYGLSLCAERTALGKAISEGALEFVKMAVAAEGRFTPVPCGACRQLLHDYAPQLVLLLSGRPGEFERITLTELLPRPFSADFFP